MRHPAPYDGTVTRGGTDGRRRVLASLVAITVGALGLAVAAPVPARAADVQLSFTMTSLVASGSRPGDTVTVEGTVANTGTLPAYGVQVIMWRSRDPIERLATLRQASSERILGSRLPITADHYVVVSTSLQAFSPGESRVVRLRSTMRELGFDTRGAAYALGADVIASATPGAATDYPTVGQLRTFLPVPDDDPVPLTSVVLLSATPTKLVDGRFASDDLVGELTGRLGLLLDAAATEGMSWLVDPALVDEVQDMADGYTVQTREGSRPGTGQAAAAAWLAEFDDLDPDAGGRTLFANPDVNGARLAGDALAVSRSQRAAAKLTGLDDLPLVVVPAGAELSQATYDSLAGSGADLVVAANTASAGALQAGPGDRPLVLATPTVQATSDGLAANLRRQLDLAAAVVAGERGQVRLLTGAADLANDREASAPWLVRRDLGELLDAGPTVARVSLQAVRPARLGVDAFDRLARLEGDFTGHAELSPASTLTPQSDAAVTRSAAAAWVGNARGFDDRVSALGRLVGLTELGRSITLDASPRFVMSARTNQFPVTITNRLTEPVVVKVVVTVTGTNSQRLSVPPSEPVTVPPDQSVTVNIRPEATANGLVTAQAHLATASGRRVTADTPIVVEVTELGVVAWIIVGVAGAVLVLASAWRIRQVQRRAAPPPEAGGAG